MSRIVNDDAIRIMELKKVFFQLGEDRRFWTDEQFNSLRASITEEIEYRRQSIRNGLELDKQDRERIARHIEQLEDE
jgi:hypothetical protein